MIVYRPGHQPAIDFASHRETLKLCLGVEQKIFEEAPCQIRRSSLPRDSAGEVATIMTLDLASIPPLIIQHDEFDGLEAAVRKHRRLS